MHYFVLTKGLETRRRKGFAVQNLGNHRAGDGCDIVFGPDDEPDITHSSKGMIQFHDPGLHSKETVYISMDAEAHRNQEYVKETLYRLKIT